MMKIFVFTLLLSITLISGCKKENTTEPTETNVNSAKNAIILLQYEYWASASKSHSYSTMKSLVVPGSNFDGATNVCKQNWGSGYELYYQLTNLKVTEFYEASAAVDGNIKMIQGTDPNYNYSGSFQSYCIYEGGRWLLHGLNVTWN